MTGIALSGWDRLGWSGGMAERWMRLRDRQSVLAAVFLFIGYVSLGFWALLKMPELTTSWEPMPVSETLAVVLAANLAMLVWRLAVRFSFVTFAYGWRQGLLSMPRLVIGNYIAMRAAWRAIARYRDTKRNGRTRWDKTAHAFPAWLGAD
jgi:adsorption protein B